MELNGALLNRNVQEAMALSADLAKHLGALDFVYLALRADPGRIAAVAKGRAARRMRLALVSVRRHTPAFDISGLAFVGPTALTMLTASLRQVSSSGLLAEDEQVYMP